MSEDMDASLIAFPRPDRDPNDMNFPTDDQMDSRKRTRSPHRARAAREKYWSYRFINPTSQRGVPHLDLHSGTSSYLPRLPDDAPIVFPTKRQLFNEAQMYPRPPRHHRSPGYKRYWPPMRRSNADRKSWEHECFDSGVNGGSAPKRIHPSNQVPHDCQYVDTVADGYVTRGLHESCDLDTILETTDGPMGYYGLHLSGPDDTSPEAGLEDDTEYKSHIQSQDVDALFDRAERLRERKLYARWAKLRKRGWDVWDAESVASSAPEWIDAGDWDEDGSLAGDFEVL